MGIDAKMINKAERALIFQWAEAASILADADATEDMKRLAMHPFKRRQKYYRDCCENGESYSIIHCIHMAKYALTMSQYDSYDAD